MIYNIFSVLYEIAMQLFANGICITANGYIAFMLILLLFGLSIFALYYTFRSIGLYRMSKNAGLVKPWRAIIPFFGMYYCYKLAPNSKFIKKRLIVYIVAIVSGACFLITSILIDVLYGIPAIVELIGYTATHGEAVPLKLYHARAIFDFNNSIAQLFNAYLSLTSIVYAVFAFIAYRNLYMSYTLKNANKFMLFSILVYVFLDSFLLAGIFIFALRKKQRVNYDSYFEARAKWMQGHQSPYGNPYGNRYGGSNGNSYGVNQGGQRYNGGQQNREIDPFEEFNSSKNTSSNTQSGEDSDDFFN